MIHTGISPHKCEFCNKVSVLVEHPSLITKSNLKIRTFEFLDVHQKRAPHQPFKTSFRGQSARVHDLQQTVHQERTFNQPYEVSKQVHMQLIRSTESSNTTPFAFQSLSHRRTPICLRRMWQIVSIERQPSVPSTQSQQGRQSRTPISLWPLPQRFHIKGPFSIASSLPHRRETVWLQSMWQSVHWQR